MRVSYIVVNFNCKQQLAYLPDSHKQPSRQTPVTAKKQLFRAALSRLKPQVSCKWSIRPERNPERNH
jgi:hypothetical protein